MQNVLIELENSLKDAKSAVELINENKDASSQVINQASLVLEDVTKQFGALHTYFDKWIIGLEKETGELFGRYDTLWKDHHGKIELQHQEFETSLTEWLAESKGVYEKLFSNYEDLWKTHNTAVQSLIKQHKELSEKVKELIDYLNSVNFPARLDKIDSSIAATLSGIQNIQGQLNTLNSEFNSKIEKVHSGLSAEVQQQGEKNDVAFKAINQKNEASYAKNKKYFTVLLIIIILNFTALVAIYLK
jgi:phage shock protein A